MIAEQEQTRIYKAVDDSERKGGKHEAVKVSILEEKVSQMSFALKVAAAVIIVLVALLILT